MSTSSILNTNSIFNFQSFNLPSNTKVTWSRWSASNLNPATSNPTTSTTHDSKGKGKQIEVDQIIQDETQNAATSSIGENSEQRPSIEGQDQGDKEPLSAKAVEDQEEITTANRHQSILSSNWNRLNKWQKVKRKDQAVINRKEGRDPIRHLLKPTFYILEFHQCMPNISHSSTSTTSSSDGDDPRASLPPKVNGKRKQRGGDVAEKNGDATSSDNRDSNNDPSSDSSEARISSRAMIKSIWTFEVTWDQEGEENKSAEEKAESSTSTSVTQEDLSSETERDRSTSLEEVKEIKDFSTGSYILNSLHRDSFWSASAFFSVETILPNQDSREPNHWFMKALSLRLADDFVYSRSSHQAQLFNNHLRKHDHSSDVSNKVNQSGINENDNGGREIEVEKHPEEDGEEGEWNEEEKAEESEEQEQVDLGDDSLRISVRRAVRLGEGFLLLPRAKDRPSRAPPPPTTTKFYPEYSSITYASFKSYSTSTSLITQLLPSRRALSTIQPQSSKSQSLQLEPGTALTLAPFEQSATFVCSLTSLNLNIGSTLNGNDSTSESESGEDPISKLSPLRQIGDSLRLELEQVGIYENERYLKEEEWIVCRLEKDENDRSTSQKQGDISASSLFPEIEEGSFLWPIRLSFWDLEAPSINSSLSQEDPNEVNDSPSTSALPLKYLSLSKLSSKTSQLLKQLSANGSRLMASAASPMPSLFNGASSSTAGPSPSTSAFTPGPTPGGYNGITTPAASHLSSLTPAPFSIPTPSNLQQGSEDQRVGVGEGKITESKEEEKDGDVDEDNSGDQDLWGGEGEDASEEENAIENGNDVEIGGEGSKAPNTDPMNEATSSQHQQAQDSRDEIGQDEEMNGSVIGSVIDGNDFEGLVTEDDFSFFDGGAFDFAPMDVDTNMNGNGSSSNNPNLQSNSMFNDEIEQDQPHPIQPSNSNHDNSISMPSDTPQGNILSTSASTSSGGIDPPSLPGFTPSSLTGSSPAFANGNGINAKTPRTPFSPYNEFNEPTIVGENDLNNLGMGSYRDRSNNETQESFESSISGDHIGSHGREESQEMSLPKIGEHDGDFPSNLNGRGIGDLGNKYEFGKFAVPLQKVNDKLEGNVNGTDRRRSTNSNGVTRRRGRRNGTLIEGNESSQTSYPWNSLGNNGTLSSSSRFNSNSNTLKSFFNPQSSSMPPIHKLRLTERGIVPGTGFVPPNVNWKLAGLEEIGSDLAMTEDSGSDNSSFREGESSDEESDDESDDGKEELTSRLIETSKSMLDSLINSPLSSSTSSISPGSRSSPGSSVSSISKEEADLDQLVQTALKGTLIRSENAIIKTEDTSVVSASHLKDLFGSFVSRSSSSSSTSSLPLSKQETSIISAVEVLEPPKVLIGCQGAVVKFEPTVLRFWDKLALTPSSGQKPISAFLLQAGSSSLDPTTSNWFSRVSQAYQLLGMGSHHFESAIEVETGGAAHGSNLTELLDQKEQNKGLWNQLLKKVLSFFESILSRGQHVVLYALQDHPTSSIYFKLQRDLRALAKGSIGSLSNYLVVVPLPSTFSSEASSNSLAVSLLPRHDSASKVDMRTFLFRLYDSLDRKVKRTTMKVIHEDPREEVTMVQYPAFTLSDDPISSANSIKFRLDRSASSPLSNRKVPLVTKNIDNPDVMTCGMLLLIAYDFSSDEVATASVIDARGQGCDLHVWNRKESLRDDLVELWKFALGFARRANILWRIVISSIDGLDERELREWSKLAQQGVFQDAPALDLTLSSIDIDFPLAFLPSLNTQSDSSIKSSNAISKTTGSAVGTVGGSEVPPGAVFFDASQTAFALYLSHRLQVAGGSHLRKDQVQQPPSPLLALQSSLIVRLPRDSDLSMSCSTSLSRSSSSPHSMGIHMLQVYKTSSSYFNLPSADSEEAKASMATDLQSRLKDVTRSFNSLQLLTRERGVSSLLPSHLSVPTLQYLPWHVAVLISLRHSLYSI